MGTTPDRVRVLIGGLDHSRLWFGLDVESQTLGVDAIITTDSRLAAHYQRRHSEIKIRFDDMIVNLPEAYARVTLPLVVTAATVLTFVQDF